MHRAAPPCAISPESSASFVVTCRSCGQAFTPTTHAIRRGDWRTGPACASPPLPYGCAGPDGAVRVGHQRHRCGGCES